MSEKFKPCPFCGNEDVSVQKKDVVFGKWLTYVYCYKCGAHGPESYIENVIAKWNRRAEVKDDEV